MKPAPLFVFALLFGMNLCAQKLDVSGRIELVGEAYQYGGMIFEWSVTNNSEDTIVVKDCVCDARLELRNEEHVYKSLLNEPKEEYFQAVYPGETVSFSFETEFIGINDLNSVDISYGPDIQPGEYEVHFTRFYYYCGRLPAIVKMDTEVTVKPPTPEMIRAVDSNYVLQDQCFYSLNARDGLGNVVEEWQSGFERSYEKRLHLLSSLAGRHTHRMLNRLFIENAFECYPWKGGELIESYLLHYADTPLAPRYARHLAHYGINEEFLSHMDSKYPGSKVTKLLHAMK